MASPRILQLAGPSFLFISFLLSMGSYLGETGVEQTTRLWTVPGHGRGNHGFGVKLRGKPGMTWENAPSLPSIFHL